MIQFEEDAISIDEKCEKYRETCSETEEDLKEEDNSNHKKMYESENQHHSKKAAVHFDDKTKFKSTNNIEI